MASVVIFVTLTFWMTSQLLQTTPMTFNTWSTESLTKQECLAFLVMPNKTKNMLIGEHLTPSDVSIGQSKIEVMENFSYLGSSINN